MFLLYPRIARRGLLFGVYVGEERSGGEEARQIARGWQTGIILWTVVSVGVGLGLFMQFRTPFAAVAGAISASCRLYGIVSPGLFPGTRSGR